MHETASSLRSNIEEGFSYCEVELVIEAFGPIGLMKIERSSIPDGILILT